MVQYLAKRIGRSILTLFVIVTLVFCLLRLMPVEGYFANYEKMTEAQIQAGLQSMGLLDPLPVQIGHFWRDALHGDLGVSHIYKLNAPVTRILAQKLPISIEMGVLAMLLSLVLGIPLGLVMGRYKAAGRISWARHSSYSFRRCLRQCTFCISRCTAPPPWAWACCSMPPTGAIGCCRCAA